MLELFSYSLSAQQTAILILVAILIGMAKTGISGAGMIAVPLIAIGFGGKASTGMLLTILIFADFFGVWHFHRHANWQHLRRLKRETPILLFRHQTGLCLLSAYWVGSQRW